MYGTLAGSDSCWAVLQTKERKLGKEFLLAEKYLRPTHNFHPRRSPIQIKCRQAFALLKGVGGRVGWGPGEGPEGVQLYIRFVKATPPRNGVRLHLTFQRLASLVGIGHESWMGPRGRTGRRIAKIPQAKQVSEKYPNSFSFNIDTSQQESKPVRASHI